MHRFFVQSVYNGNYQMKLVGGFKNGITKYQFIAMRRNLL